METVARESADDIYTKESFRNPPAKYRGTPFFAWNAKIEPEVVKERLEEYAAMGMGGCCIHSRIGLDTEYLGKDFMELTRMCVEINKSRGMHTLLYDEDKWPSGYGGGRATREERFRSRYLLFSPSLYEEGDFHRHKVSGTRLVLDGSLKRLAVYEVSRKDGYLEGYRRLSEGGGASSRELWHAYLIVTGPSPWFNNQSYLDTLNPEAVKEFLKVTYEPYSRELGDEFSVSIPGIFTDEPQFALKENFVSSDGMEEVGIPYTEGFEELFFNTCGCSLLDRLPELFWEAENPEDYSFRCHYHNLIAEQFCRAYVDTIGSWCQKHGLQLTGHVMNEPTLDSQSRAVGEAMRTYRSFGIPGVDILAWRLEYNTLKQAQSVVRQYGRGGLASELYGATNWDFDFCGHKGMGDWQAALGVTHRVHHVSWYSMNGEAKRDYPAPIDGHSPWYKEYDLIEGYFARVRMAMEQGHPLVRVGVIHPVESYWMSLGPDDRTGRLRQELDDRFEALTRWLLFETVDFDFIAESSVADMYKGCSGKKLLFGVMEYDVVLVPPLRTIRSSTLCMLRELDASGGKVIFVGPVPEYVDGRRKKTEILGGMNTSKVSFDRQAVTEALEPFREVEILEEDGNRCREYFYQLRENGNERWLFLAKGKPDKERTRAVLRHRNVVVKGTYCCHFPDPVSGEYRQIPWNMVGNETHIAWECYEQDSLLVHLERMECRVGRDETENKRQIKEGICQAGAVFRKELSDAVPYTLEEPNVMLLDQPYYSLDGRNWQGPEEILRLDDCLRKRLGFTLRTESFPQPWLSLKYKSPTHRTSLRFIICSETDGLEIRVAAEGEPCRLLWNNQEVSLQKDGWYVDRCYGVWKLGTLRKGENELLFEFPYGERTNLEWCYLLGDFGTRINGRHVLLTERPKTVCYGDITRQGMAFYGGNLTYITEEELPEGNLEVEIPHYQAPLLKVILDGTVSDIITVAPYRARLGKVEAGSHEIKIICYGSRFNTFGQLHNNNAGEVYYGPKTWRTSDDCWSYEYKLREAGVLEPPVLYVRAAIQSAVSCEAKIMQKT